MADASQVQAWNAINKEEGHTSNQPMTRHSLEKKIVHLEAAELCLCTTDCREHENVGQDLLHGMSCPIHRMLLH